MKLTRLSLSSALAIGLVISGSQLFAQDQNASPNSSASQSSSQSETQPMQREHHGARSHGHKMNPERAVEKMTKRYNLTSDQQSQIRTILTNQQQQMQSLREDKSMSKSDRWSKMKGIRSDTDAKIEGTLNPEQKEKFQQDRQRMQERMERRHEQSGHHANESSGSEAPQAPQSQQ